MTKRHYGWHYPDGIDWCVKIVFFLQFSGNVAMIWHSRFLFLSSKMDDIYQRLRLVMCKFSGSRENFCQDTGIAASCIRQIFKRKCEITYTDLLKMCTAYPMLNVQWLMLGTGAMKLHSNVDDNEIDIVIKVTENLHIKLRIHRQKESFYREVGKTLRERIFYYQRKYTITEERALQVTAYFFTLKPGEPKDAAHAFGVLKSTIISYAGRVRPENLKAAVAYALTCQNKRLQDATVSRSS